MDITCGTLSSLVDKILDLVIDLTWEQLRYLFQYHRNIEELNERVEELTLERSSIQHRIDEATNNVEQIEDKVLHWLSKVDQITEQTQMFHEEESQAKTECSVTSCPNLWLRYKLSKRAKAMAQQAVEIYGKRNFDRIYHVPPLAKSEFLNRESNEGIGSRIQVVNQIMEELHNPSVNIVGLCGLGGVGKTTIAKEVAEKAKNQNMFKEVIMATVSKELNVEKIQGQIAEKLGMQLDDKFEQVRAYRLCERLKKEKNMLLILDDLWEELDFGRVGIPFVDVGSYSKKNEGCKILLTSRNKSLLLYLMRCQEIIEVEVLLEKEALELFNRIAELSIDSSNLELISVASEIVQKCGGLPLAIATVAKVLRGKSLDEWQDYLARWKNYLRRSSTGIREVDASLKLGYDPLSLENKTIFLLSAMSSHDPSIEDLLMYSVGLDVLEGIENMEEAHVGISTIVRKLKSSNLFVDSISGHHVTIHDIFRDFALSIAPNELNAFIVWHRSLQEWPDKNKLEGYKGICLQKSDINHLPEELHGPRLEFFLLDSSKRDLTIPNMFFNSSKELKLLAFTNVDFSPLPSLSFLLKLKTLCLHSCLLEDITEVRSLKNLVVLSLACSEIQRLPAELAELSSLQMLNLAHCSNLEVIPSKLLSSFKKLEVLYMENSFIQWKVVGSGEANENASLEELKDLPLSSLNIHIPNVSMLSENLFLDMNLKRYRMLIGTYWTWGDVNYESSKILKLELENNIHLKPGVRKLMKGAEDLCLYGSNGLENVLHGDDGRGFLGFSHLRHLQIVSNDTIILNSAHHEAATNNISSKMSEPFLNKVLLPKLEILELFNSISLIPLIWDDQLSYTSFSNLKTLKVKKCGFVKLVPLRVLKSLNNLEELEVRDCHMLETVFGFEDLSENEEVSSSIPSVVVPLKKLKLHRLPKLMNVWSNHRRESVFSFPSLRSANVSSCKRLTSMFPASIAKGMLRDLEELHIKNCGIDVIVAKDQVSESVASVFVFPRLTSLKLSWLQNLRNIYPQRHTLHWPQLQRLCIEYCDELEIFEKEASSLLEICEEESTDSKYPLLSCVKDIGNLEALRLVGKQAKIIGSGQFPMVFPKVKLLHLSVKKAATISYKSLWKSFPKLEELELEGGIEEAFGADDVPFPIKLTLQNLCNMTSLAPSLVSLSNLTCLRVVFSRELTTLMTSSTARSLVHLTRLSIVACPEMEEIIFKQEGEDDEDKEIVFNKLQYLWLCCLPRLKRFCSHNYTLRFPLLDILIIEVCRKLEIFSLGLVDTPSLESIKLAHYWGKHHETWDTNLNKTIRQQRFVATRELALDEEDVSMIRNDQLPALEAPKLSKVKTEVHDMDYKDEGKLNRTREMLSSAKRFVGTRELALDEEGVSMIRNGQFPADRFSHVEIIRIEGFVDEWVTFPCALLERFPQLSELHVKHSSFEEIFPSHDAHIVHKIPPFKKLHLACLDKLKNIWRHDSDLITSAPSSTSFHYLTVLKVSECHQLFCLMTNSTAKSLVNLETLEIDDCEKMEEIVKNETNEDVEGRITFNALRILKLTSLPRLKAEEDKTDFNIEDQATNTRCRNISRSLFSHHKVSFPKLEILELSSLNCLIPLIWGDQFSHNSFSNLKTLSVTRCGFVKLVPLRVLKSLSNLEELEVMKCYMLEMVFDFEDLNDYKEMESSSMVVPLKKLRLEGLPKLENVWSNHYHGTVSFPSVRSLRVSSCKSLTSMFPASIAKCMLCHLEELRIDDCGIDEIVAKDQVSESVTVGLEFRRLTSLGLFSLWNLRNFYPQKHTLEWPCLQQLSIKKCDELEIFEKEVSSSFEILEEKSTQDSKYPLLSYSKVPHNLEELTLKGRGAEMIGSGRIPMYCFPKVKLLKLYVDGATTVSYKSLLKSFPNLEELTLGGGMKKAFRGDDVPLPMKLTLDHISNMTSFAASLVSSPNLTHLHVTSCHRLTTLMSSVARSLVHLIRLSISWCNNIEEIISKQEGENDEDKEIIFSKLQYLKFENLPRLKRFCGYNYTFRFPLLDQLIITVCPKFKIFSPGLTDTPSLESVQLLQDWSGEHHEIWDTNLNKTFYQQRFIASRELVLDEYDASMIRNDQLPVDSCPKVEILGIEGFVDEGVTFPYTLLGRFPQLNELHVKRSSFEEIFPSHNAHIVHQIPPLKKLYLTKLDQLKNITRDSQLHSIQNLQILHVLNCSNLITLAPSSTSFGNLMVLKVSECHQLIYLMTNSTAKSLVNLETLEINNCKKMEEIVKNETNEDVEGGITFTVLRILELTLLPRLKTEEDKTDFNMEDQATNNRCRNIFRPLFSHHKALLPKLEILQLSDLNNLIPLIWDDQLSNNSFSNLKTLTVQWCGFVKLVPLHVLKSLYNLEELEVKHCRMLETVFDFEDWNDYKEMVSSLVVVPLKKLRLEGLPKLKNVLSNNHRQGDINLATPLVSSPNGLDHQIEEVMTEHKEEGNEDKEIIFSKLELLELGELPRLKSFCGQNYTFKFPLLQCVTITECPQLTIFCPGTIYTSWLQSIRVNQDESHKDIWMTDLNTTIQRRFTTHEVISTAKSMALNAENITMIVDVFPEVRTLYVESFRVEGVTFPYSSLERFPKLVKLYVEHSSFEEIFPSQDQIVDFMGKIPPFEELYIASGDELNTIWKDDSQLPPIHQNLRVLEVQSCCNLVQLAPSSVSLENLWKLSVSRCHQLIHLVTSSTAKSFVNLLILEINDCNNMEEIVTNETNEDVEGGITFNRLRSIELTDMPSLKMFSSQSHSFGFPDLQEIKITGCPEMKMFCPGGLETPELSKVKIEGHDMEWKDEGDLNKIIEILSSAKDSVNI